MSLVSLNLQVVVSLAELGKKTMKKKNIHAPIIYKMKKMIKVPLKWALTERCVKIIPVLNRVEILKGRI